MISIIKILERELDDTDLAYIYKEEDGRWYAYERSAFLLNRLMNGCLIAERLVVEGTLWLARVEVYPDQLPVDNIVSVSEQEYVVRHAYIHQFHEWLGDMMDNTNNQTFKTVTTI